MTTEKSPSKKSLLASRIIAALCILFLLFDAIMKVVENHFSVEGSIALDWPVHGVQSLGIVLLLCTIVYIIPRTAILGAILLTAYLGGAVSIMVRAGEPFYFPVVFGVLVWAGLFLRDERLRALIPFTR